MAWSAVSSAVLRIGQLLSQEATSLWGVEEQVEDLQRELQWMQSFLQEADTRKVADNEVVRTGVAEIRELAYDAEDVIESFILNIVSKRKAGVCNAITRSACFLNDGWLLHKTKSGVEKITTRIKKLKSRLQTYDVRRIREELGGASTSSNARRESRRPYPHIVDDHVVGLDDDINQLLSILVEDETNRCRVVSICGMGGLGKTTLAKKIYSHSQVISHFDYLAWTYVSQQCHYRKVWEDILSGLLLVDKDDRKKRDEELAEKLCKVLKEKKCLVIVDDIWSTEAWDSLEVAFPMADTSSKILLTSRNMDIVHHADPRGGYLFKLKCLNEEESWTLFQKFAFPDKDYPGYRVDSKMEELGKTMVEDCGGLPLAIIVLGGILAKKNSLNQWQTMSENVRSYLNKEKGQVSEQVLALSYEDLSPSLKSCFLYLSHFPEDYVIYVDTLIQLWVAEGIVSWNGGETMEDVAESYLNELVERCLIQVGERDPTLRIKTCYMHDLMRDLCLSKAKQENFVFIIDHSNCSSQSSRNYFSPASISPSVRRIVEHEFTPIQLIRRNSRLRSILFFCDELFAEEWLTPGMLRYWKNHFDDESVNFYMWYLRSLILYKMHRYWTCMFKSFKLLRVLGFEGEDGFVGGCKLPSAIGNLIHLRFLSLRDMEFMCPNIPSSLGNLRCLQTLDLRVECDGGSSIYIPNVIWRLKQLRHLYLPLECNPKTKLKLHTLANLQTLVNFTEHCCIEDLCNLINLRTLNMFGIFNTEDLGKKSPMAIIKSKHMRSLSINCFGFDSRNITLLILSSCLSTICELSLGAEIGKLPEHQHLFSNIAYLLLRRCKLEEDPMPTLGKLPNLRILKLEDSAFIGNKMVCSAKCFPKLDSLTLRVLHDLEEWELEMGAMPTLHRLEISYCSRLKMLPEGLKFITTLQELMIGSSFKSKLERGGEDFYKVQHIPSIIFL